MSNNNNNNNNNNEDDNHKSVLDHRAVDYAVAEDSTKMISRPKKLIKMGKSIPLKVNHFSFKLSYTTIYQYAVDFEPEIEHKRAKFQMLKNQSDILGENIIFDGRQLFLTNELGDITLQATHRNVDYDINIIQTNKLDPTSTLVPLQVYNVLFGQILRLLKLKPIGRQYFDPLSPISIPKHKVELWPGYFTSISPTKTGVVLIADVAHKILRQDNVLDYLKDMMRKSRGGNTKKMAESNLIGQIVLTRYNNRTYRIDSIDWKKSPRSTFTKRSGEELSYQQYYSVVHQKDIQDLKQPLLVHKHHKRGSGAEIIYLIPELCTMTGITDEMRKDFKVMKDISIHTRVSPANRGRELEQFAKKINTKNSTKEELSKWGTKFNDKLTSLNGIVFDPEKIYFSDCSVMTNNKGEWSQAIKKSKVIEPIKLLNWVVVYHRNNKKEMNELVNGINKVGYPIGIQMKKPFVKETNNDSAGAFVDAIYDSINDNTQMVVCLLPNKRKDRYNEIKKVCCCDLAVPSQCVVARSLSRKQTLLSICNKIIQQMNCKLGGQLWRINVPLSNLMIIGIDVCHDTQKRSGEESVVGFCATMNKNQTKYYSRVTFQSSGQEIIDGLQMCITEALRNYFKLNNYLPDRIFVYRDGVGDGMLQAVLNHEVPQILEAFEAYEDWEPSTTVIVVKKRIHTRVFAVNQGRNKLGNPPPGTVVDDICIHPTWYDFYLISQSVGQGTVTPTHYHVIYDDSGYDPTYVQNLTFKMCHLYYNWPGTVRVPAPCHYAHKIAFIVGQSIHKDPHKDLRNNLYFL